MIRVPCTTEMAPLQSFVAAALHSARVLTSVGTTVATMTAGGQKAWAVKYLGGIEKHSWDDTGNSEVNGAPINDLVNPRGARTFEDSRIGGIKRSK